MKGITSTVQEIKTKSKSKSTEYTKYVTPIPNAIVDLAGIKKGDKLRCVLHNCQFIVEMDDMIDALVELLEEKGIMTTEEWEAKIKEKIGA